MTFNQQIEIIENQVKDLKNTLTSLIRQRDARLEKLNLTKAILWLVSTEGQSSWWINRYSFQCGDIKIYGKCVFLDWYLKVFYKEQLVFQGDDEGKVEIFHDDCWADTLSNRYRKSFAKAEILRLQKEIDNYVPR